MTDMTDRIQFAGAVRRARDAAWKRHLTTARTPAPTIRITFSDLLVALAETPPVNIIGEADATDMEERAEHVQALLTAVETYLTAVIADAKHRTSGLDFDVNVAGILSDTRGDIVGTFKIAAEQMREFEREFEP
jgi:hypothetical protein